MFCAEDLLEIAFYYYKKRKFLEQYQYSGSLIWDFQDWIRF